ncbi:MAG: GreA/GreB family elongation factor [Candidatus Moeniiplasma glomeromycotorum]|nr:GreA/GreB family elongation factor [Candidatus Moeniiplasma glomeromycotorum]
MKKNNKKVQVILQEKLQEIEKDYLNTIEKLKVYGAKDSSENSDWILLNEKLAIYQDQINSLKAKIEMADRENDKIIIYRQLETGEKKIIRLTDGETDPEEGRISRISPLGMIFSDKKVGEILEFKQEKYQILNIEEE